jgi:translation initiation factor IF-1
VDTSQNKSSQRKSETAEGTVIEALPDTLFRVKFDDSGPLKGEEKLAYLAGKMRMNHIRVIIGDRVLVELDSYGGKGRITKRL